MFNSLKYLSVALILSMTVAIESRATVETQTVLGDNAAATSLYTPTESVDTLGYSAKFALKTNLLEWLATTINGGVEVTGSRHWSFELTGSLNPFTFSNNKKWKHYQVCFEPRYWFKESMNGHFIGVHVGGGEYNVAGIKVPFWNFKKEYRYEGWHIRAGVTYGYHWAFHRHWSLEALLGLGVVYTNYDQFDCKNCGPKRGTHNRTFFAPTRLAVNLVYTLGRPRRPEPVRTVFLPGIDRIDTITRVDTVFHEASPTLQDRYHFLHLKGTHAKGAKLPIRYPLDDATLYTDYSRNAASLDSILKAFDAIFSDPSVKISSVNITGYASPEGRWERNQWLGQHRAEALRDYILAHESRLTPADITITNGAEDWEGLRQLVVESDMVGKAQVLNIIDNYPPEERKTRLRALNGGRTYRSILDVLYPQLRAACYLEVWYEPAK
jgi:hypothetical protein